MFVVTSAWESVKILLAVLVMGLFASAPLVAQESVCARVKIEIKQDLTLERQAFDAEMRITNFLPTTSLTEVSVHVNVTDELGAPFSVMTDPNSSLSTKGTGDCFQPENKQSGAGKAGGQ